MEFRLFGNLELIADGKLVDLPGNRMRAFAACMLMHVGEPITKERLSAHIWDEPPSSAAANLRSYATVFRRTLGAAENGADRCLKTTSGTYQLLFDPSDIDVVLFDDAVAESERSLEYGDLACAARKLDCALGLWRGKPIQNVRGSWLLSARVDSIEERYVAAVERRADLFSAAQDLAGSIHCLRNLVSEFPLNERLWGKLMTALTNSGRRAEALTAYHRAREQISDATGMEPGAELKRIHSAVLKGEPI
jgi:DNA-binding SARP family transcriptional activator